MSGDLDLAGQTALVVGGSSGIGNAIASALRDAGAQVCVTGTRPSPHDYADPRTSFDAMHYRQLDATDGDAVDALELPFGSLSLLVASQGVAPSDDGDPLDPELFRRVLDVNLLSVARLCHAFRPMLAQTRGSAILIGSLACFVAVPHRPSYGASKGGLLTLTRSLAAGWAADAIRVNGIAPGYIDTRMSDAHRGDPARSARVEARVPMGRWGDAAEIGGAALFLASPLASYVTGQMIAVDGGLSL